MLFYIAMSISHSPDWRVWQKMAIADGLLGRILTKSPILASLNNRLWVAFPTPCSCKYSLNISFIYSISRIYIGIYIFSCTKYYYNTLSIPSLSHRNMYFYVVHPSATWILTVHLEIYVPFTETYKNGNGHKLKRHWATITKILQCFTEQRRWPLIF